MGFHLFPYRLFDSDKESLRDALPSFHSDGMIGDILHLDQDLISLTTVILVNHPQAMGTDERFLAREGGTRDDEECKTLRNRNNHVPRHEADAPCGNQCCLACDKVESRSASGLIARKRQRFIESLDGHVHGCIVA